MSAAKVKMRGKKMRNQPVSVQYPSSSAQNGGDTPNPERTKNPHQRGGWVRGHQKDGGGYTKEMPKHITAGSFASARAAEVQAMLKAVTKTTGSCHVYGALPKHMRRRSMSHNTKRLPRRLRDVANRMREKSLQAGSKKKKEQPKSKSRKARRRHGNLLLEFNRRQRKNMWLETHIWHAKRFHMVKKWGYCLGDRPTYKCYRPCYRAMSSHCLLQDLLPELQTVCQCCEAVVPPVVPVVIPAGVVLTPEPESEKTPEAQQVTGTKRKRSGKDASVPPAKKILGDGTRSPTTPVTWKSSSTGIVINDLTLEIVRYRLIGPQSHSVLAETLEAATDCHEIDKSQSSPLWWPEHCKDENKMNLHQQQADVYHILKGIYSTGELPPGTVLGLTVDDPRVTLPTKKVKALPCVKQAQEVDEEKRKELMLQGVPEHCCQSYLWEQSVRDNVTDNKISEQDLNRMKSEVLVPGSRLSPIPLQGRVPILLVHQPGKQVGHEMSSWGAGWDLLLPKGWGMAFWVPLVYRGVRIGGLNMTLKHSQNKGVSHFPHDYPDCPAGVRFQEEQESELLDKFKRRPPAKRTNYIKHGCLAPFRCPWQQLAEEWELITREGESQTTTEADTVMEEEMTSHRDITVTKPQSHVTVLSCNIVSRNTCDEPGVGASVTAVQGQTRIPCHGVCANCRRPATAEKRVQQHLAPRSLRTKTILKVELNAKRRATRKPLHPLCFRRPTTKSQTFPSTSEPNPTTSEDPKSSSQSTSDLIFGLWPDPLPSVTSHCSRVTLGWVTQGDFSLSAGCGEALGFVSVAGLLNTFVNQPMEHRGTLLLRNPTSLHYRFAKINIEV
ncbi:Ribonucleases P/MRP protein subunit POP1 [Larimichthys crocea]|uniref:Uncharacterized protein n=1 Tax=Larimichthys crocea TaxID=215358 RepID=A0ACD3QVV7_LARCR|nr:Ribonucleases P/MRP protein subunit POP1 [Larimichthys crocea]